MHAPRGDRSTGAVWAPRLGGAAIVGYVMTVVVLIVPLGVARAAGQRIVTVPTMPYASCAGRWQMYWSEPVASKVIVVTRVSPAGITSSVGREGWSSSVPVRCFAWTASSPTIHSWSIGSLLRR